MRETGRTGFRGRPALGSIDHGEQHVIADREVVGVEIAELDMHPDRTAPDLEPLLAALTPLLDVVARS